MTTPYASRTASVAVRPNEHPRVASLGSAPARASVPYAHSYLTRDGVREEVRYLPPVAATYARFGEVRPDGSSGILPKGYGLAWFRPRFRESGTYALGPIVRTHLPIRWAPDRDVTYRPVRPERARLWSKVSGLPETVGHTGCSWAEVYSAVDARDPEILGMVLQGHPEEEAILETLSRPVSQHDLAVGFADGETTDSERESAVPPERLESTDPRDHAVFNVRFLECWRGGFSPVLFKEHVRVSTLKRATFGLPHRAGGSQTAPSRVLKGRGTPHKASGPLSFEARKAQALAKHRAMKAR